MPPKECYSEESMTLKIDQLGEDMREMKLFKSTLEGRMMLILGLVLGNLGVGLGTLAKVFLGGH